MHRVDITMLFALLIEYSLRTYLSAASREEQHRLALLKQLVGSARRRRHCPKPLKEWPCGPIPVPPMRQAPYLQTGSIIKPMCVTLSCKESLSKGLVQGPWHAVQQQVACDTLMEDSRI